MRPRYKPPRKQKYFHSKQRISKNDLNFLIKKIEIMNKRKIKRNLMKKIKENSCRNIF
jgi:hypothetical protein